MFSKKAIILFLGVLFGLAVLFYIQSYLKKSETFEKISVFTKNETIVENEKESIFSTISANYPKYFNVPANWSLFESKDSGIVFYLPQDYKYNSQISPPKKASAQHSYAFTHVTQKERNFYVYIFSIPLDSYLKPYRDSALPVKPEDNPETPGDESANRAYKPSPNIVKETPFLGIKGIKGTLLEVRGRDKEYQILFSDSGTDKLVVFELDMQTASITDMEILKTAASSLGFYED